MGSLQIFGRPKKKQNVCMCFLIRSDRIHLPRPRPPTASTQEQTNCGTRVHLGYTPGCLSVAAIFNSPSQFSGKVIGHVEVFLVGDGYLHRRLLVTPSDQLDAVLHVPLLLHQDVKVRLVENLGGAGRAAAKSRPKSRVARVINSKSGCAMPML